MRDKYEHFNDNMWLDAKCDEAYYNGKIEGCVEIDKLLDECHTEEEFINKLTDKQHTAEASRDADGDGDGFAYYDGVVASYREMLEEIEDE